MNRLRLLLVLSFLESFAGSLVQRGVYFYTHERLGYGKELNLWLALALGAVYVVGAIPSHRLCRMFGEKRVLRLSIAGQALGNALLWLGPASWGMWAGAMACQLFHGMMWPVIESYLGAGRTPAQTSRAVGIFNLTWSGAIPVALLVTGPIIASSGVALFLIAGLVHLCMLAAVQPFAPAPVHLPIDHPERLPADTLHRFRGLMWSSRWSLMGGYVLMFVLAPLLPNILEDGFKVTVTAATALAALMDVARWCTFFVMSRTQRWHGSELLAACVVVLLPAAAFVVLLGHFLTLVIGAWMIFGVAVGLGYYAALYYAMVLTNASVNAGGAHEGLIGVGFTIGPAAGLVAVALTPTLGDLAMIAGIGPVALACAAAGAWPIVRIAKARHG
jgi:predicted MFS family arabinose efflux permease